MLEILQVDKQDELEQVRGLFRGYADYLKIEFPEYAGLPWSKDFFQNYDEEISGLPGDYAPPKGCILLAMYNSKAAGCIAVKEASCGTCEMKRLFVRPEYQRLGIGKTLCQAVIEWAKKVGFTHMRLWTALDGAKALYESLGFEEIDSYEFVPAEIEGAVFMELSLV